MYRGPSTRHPDPSARILDWPFAISRRSSHRTCRAAQWSRRATPTERRRRRRDVGNSTFTTDIGKVDPSRLLQCYIAEQNLVGVAMGLACRGKIPFASSFACFLARGYDFMRLAAISSTNIKLVGTHAGVSIGEDGASQMGLEDLAMACAEPNYTVF